MKRLTDINLIKLQMQHVVKEKSSMDQKTPNENLPPLIIGSIINDFSNATEVAE